MMKRTFAAGAVALLAVGTAASAAPAPTQPKLIVAISIDQFSDELYQRYRPSFTGGLKRLSQGITFTGYQSHAATETCPGHSTILTGRHPANTGIVANTWLDAKSGKRVYCVSVPGADPEARGPQNMKADTLGDWLKRSQPNARVVSISGKDRAAITLGGHHADAVYWWKDGEGFTTSSYAGPATDAVLAPAKAFNAVVTARWQAGVPQFWPAAVPAACAALARPRTFGQRHLSGTIPPEGGRVEAGKTDIARDAAFQDQARVSPSFDPMTLDFVDEVIDRDQLGHGPATDLLAVSLSATDYIGHRYGNGGPEMCVQMAGLDRALGAFFDKLDALQVPYVVALTADHGASDAAERLVERNIAAKRIDAGALMAALNADLRRELGLTSDPIAAEDPEQLSIRVADPAMRGRVRDAAVGWLKARPEVVEVFTPEQVVAAVPRRGKSPAKLTLAERFNESYDAERSGDIQVALQRYASFGVPKKATDTVAGHGSPWDYDRRVPMLFWWQGVRPAKRAEAVETVDIAPTLAAIAAVPAPPVDGRCLRVVTRACR